jgi:hypothetical protein
LIGPAQTTIATPQGDAEQRSIGFDINIFRFCPPRSPDNLDACLIGRHVSLRVDGDRDLRATPSRASRHSSLCSTCAGPCIHRLRWMLSLRSWWSCLRGEAWKRESYRYRAPRPVGVPSSRVERVRAACPGTAFSRQRLAILP